MSSPTEILLESVRSTVIVGKALGERPGPETGWGRPTEGSFLTRLPGNTEVPEEESLCLAGDDPGRLPGGGGEMLGAQEHILRSASQVWSLAGESDLGQGFGERGMWRMWQIWPGPLLGNLG